MVNNVVCNYCSKKGNSYLPRAPASSRSFMISLMIRSRIRCRRIKTMAIPKQAPRMDLRRKYPAAAPIGRNIMPERNVYEPVKNCIRNNPRLIPVIV